MDFMSFLFLVLVIANVVLAAVSAVYAKEAQESSAEALRRQIWCEQRIQEITEYVRDQGKK